MLKNNQNIGESQNSVLSTDKNAKYDRQLRLWGAHGQTNLENARVCLCNATVVGTETLKSMVLPGIGFFTIIDEAVITEDDAASNFFLPYESIGQSRAEIACKNLCELNPDVKGEHFSENIDQILNNRPEYLKSFSLIIVSNLRETLLKKLAQYLWTESVPLVVLQSFGFIGSIRIIEPEHAVIEAHPDNELPDLRLDQPFDELKSYCDSIDLSKISDHDHSHLPYLIVIYKFLQDWKSSHNGEMPKNYKEKEKFKDMIRSGILVNEDEIPKFEENFEEAIKNVNNCVTTTKIPSEIQKLFENEKCLNITSKSKQFWIILRAIKEFTENEGQGQLPLRGTIPDMFSDSDKFIYLQNIYRTKAQNDIDIVKSRVERILINIDKNFDCINEQLVKLFCKNAYFIKSINYRSLNDEYDPQSSNLPQLFDQDPDENLYYYVLLRVIERYYCEYNRYPCYKDTYQTVTLRDQTADVADLNQLKRFVQEFLNEYGISLTIPEKYVNEICRFSNCELHSISSFLGGCAAHECIKLLTNQFVPINNTLIYNGIMQTTSVYQL